MISRLQTIQNRFSEEETMLDITRHHEITLAWLYGNGLLKRDILCPKCSQANLKIENDNSKADRRRFRCPRTDCRKTASIRTGSIFENSKLTLMEYTRIVFYYFLNNVCRSQVLKELPIDKNTVSELYSSTREQISLFVRGEQLGYQIGDIVEDIEDTHLGVEIDESLFSHINGEQVWVFGLFDRRTSEARAFVVENRTADVLIPLIIANVTPGARIYSDGWAAYSSLSDHGFDHRVVNHSVGFGHGFFTTNHIESIWSELKFLTKKSQGIVKGYGENKREGIQHHIDVGIWRLRNKGENLAERLVFVFNCLYG